MSVIPKTTTKGAQAGRRWPLYVLVLLALAALVLVVEAFLRGEGFTPGEEISSPGVRDVAVSAENSLYPPPDVGAFGWRPERAYVYLSVEDLPLEEEEALSASVERSGSRSAFALLGRGGGEADLTITDSGEDRITRNENGATGVVKLVLKTRSGEPLPSGNYTVSVGDGEGPPTVRKLFSVGR